MADDSEDTAAGIGCALILLFGVFFGLHQCTKEDPPTAEEIAAEEAEDAENRRKGFHCLSSWDGSHRRLVDFVENGLRNPDSFEHIETTITPVNIETGKHGVSMRFRAQNGFGGMNVGRAVAEVDPDTCAISNVLVDS